MDVTVAQDTDEQLWDSMVDRTENATIWHTWRWLKLLENYSVLKKAGFTARAKLEPLILSDRGRPVGICPLFFFRVMGLTYCYSPLSQEDTHYLGPLFPEVPGAGQKAAQVFWLDASRAIDRFIRKIRKSSYVHISSSPGIDDCRPFRWAGYKIEPRYTYYIDLTPGTDAIWNGFKKEVRYSVGKARKDGITVSEGNREDALHIWELLKKRNRVKFPKEFIGAACDGFFPDRMKIFVARKGSERLSGVILLLYRDKASLWIGPPKLPGIVLNELVIWESIAWATAQGFRTFEIVGADDYPLFTFKRKFNGKLVQFFHMNWYAPPLDAAISLYNALFRGGRNQIEHEIS